MESPRLRELQALVQEHYDERLDWTNEPYYGGSAHADVDHHTVSVMVEPPRGQPHISKIAGRRQESLDEWLVEQLAMDL